MKTYNFDEIIPRKGTMCIKYDAAKERGKAEDILPLWVADMDFQCADPILQAIHDTANHGIYGYSSPDHTYFDAIASWMQSHHNWTVKKDWLVTTPGVVFAISQAIRAFSKEGDAILIQQPVYYPFSNQIQKNNRKLVSNDLVYKDGSYIIDFTDFEQKIIENNVRIFILCSPHNPVGRVWTKDELQKIGSICKKHNVLIVSDEIHADFTYDGFTHTPFILACPDLQDQTIVCTAPSKTFNIAGLQCSNIFIPNKTLRSQFVDEIDRTGYCEMNTIALKASVAAYAHGDEWFSQLKAYLAKNLAFVRTYLAEHLPTARLVEPQGTYLVWIDFSGYGYTDAELNDRISNKAKVWLDEGSIFGKSGEQFERFNIACPTSIIKQALDQIALAL
ncbi:MAG: pyridoxal phosphate-dependent aminotransferase [Treponema sp.]|nr:pyridoxal phosphate-dependent aminotransferase [Treponema sp.]